MSRYYFDVRDGSVFPDDTGTELPNIETAREQAVRFSGKLLTDLGAKFWDVGDWRISVRDESGRVLFGLSLAATDAAPTRIQDRSSPEPSPPA